MTKYGMTTGKDNIVFSSNSEVTSTLGTGISSDYGRSGNSLFPITGYKLNGNNFFQWSQSVMMFVCGKEKDNYLTDDITPLEKEDPKYKTWKLENNMVMSWLINFMNNEIGENFMFYGTTKEI